MQQLEWCEEASVGVPELDAQHRRLLELLGELVKHTQSGETVDSSAAIAELTRYAERHLQQEELWLRARHYPDYAEHKAEHDAYRKKAAALQALAGRRDFGIRVANFVAEWWRFHIRVTDQRYARYFLSHSAEPVTATGPAPIEPGV
jgi:hemerythrin